MPKIGLPIDPPLIFLGIWLLLSAVITIIVGALLASGSKKRVPESVLLKQEAPSQEKILLDKIFPELRAMGEKLMRLETELKNLRTDQSKLVDRFPEISSKIETEIQGVKAALQKIETQAATPKSAPLPIESVLKVTVNQNPTASGAPTTATASSQPATPATPVPSSPPPAAAAASTPPPAPPAQPAPASAASSAAPTETAAASTEPPKKEETKPGAGPSAADILALLQKKK